MSAETQGTNFSPFREEEISALRRRWGCLTGRDLATKLPPTPYVCEALGLAPGPVTLLGGAGFGGKTMSAMSLALSIISGKLAWGKFLVKQGKITHIDYEQARHLTQIRYQRMAKAMGISLIELEHSIDVICMPSSRLDDTSGNPELDLKQLLYGSTLAIVDSFRCAFPNAKENDSGARHHLDMLSRVSIATECTIIVIAHSRKPTDDKDVRSALRGSGALFDAAQSVFMLDGQTHGQPIKFTHTKCRNLGVLVPTFGLSIEDVEGTDDESNLLDKRWGLRVAYRSPEELQAAGIEKESDLDKDLAASADRISTLALRIITRIGFGQENSLPTFSIKSGLHSICTSADLQTALYTMVQSGDLIEVGKGNEKAYYRPIRRQPGED